MAMKTHIILCIIIFIFSAESTAKQPFKVVVGLSKPPYVIQKNNTGFELELIQQLLTTINKEPEFIFIPYGRSEKMLALPDIDAVMTINKNTFKNSSFISDTYINYQNVAISLKAQKIQLNNITDIGNYSVASFQSAHKLLGNKFALAVAKSPLYLQVADQEKQLELLQLGRVQVLIMDIKIFLHYLAKQKENIQLNEIDIHALFPLSPYSVAFKNKTDVEAFNQTLKAFKSTSEYQTLLKKYNF